MSERLTQLQRQGDVAAMAETITDEMLDVYAVTSTWADLPARLVAKYADVAECLIFYFATEAWEKGPALMARYQDAIALTKRLSSA